MNTTSVQDRTQRAAIIASLKAYADTPAPIAPERIRQLITFENQLYPVLQADKRWFFAHTTTVEGIQFARDMYVMHSLAANSLQQLVERRGEWSQGDSDVLLQRVMAFAFYHQCAAVKWCFFRHEPVKPTIWPELHDLFLFAETHGFATTPVELFDAEAQYATTVQSLYLRALLMDVLNTGGLTMPQIEIADGWLAEWTPDYALDANYSPRSHALFVDLGAMAGLQLVTGAVAAESTHRYMRVDGLKEQVEVVRSALRAGHAYLGRGTQTGFPVEEQVTLLGTIERLYQTLLHASASRIEERTQVANLQAEVRLGLEEARRVIAGETGVAPAAGNAEAPMKFGDFELSLEPVAAPQAALPTPAADERWTRWKVHDMSSKGVGLMVDRATGERISVGQLLAVKPDGFDEWMIGVIVRKLTQRALGETLLGIELLSYRPLPVSLRRYTQARDTEPEGGAPVAALYLPGRDRDGKSDILALPAGDFGLKNVFALRTTRGQFRVRINRVLRKGGDWVGLRFEVIGKK
jgi:hypothetical protein